MTLFLTIIGVATWQLIINFNQDDFIEVEYSKVLSSQEINDIVLQLNFGHSSYVIMDNNDFDFQKISFNAYMPDSHIDKKTKNIVSGYYMPKANRHQYFGIGMEFYNLESGKAQFTNRKSDYFPNAPHYLCTHNGKILNDARFRIGGLYLWDIENKTYEKLFENELESPYVNFRCAGENVYISGFASGDEMALFKYSFKTNTLTKVFTRNNDISLPDFFFEIDDIIYGVSTKMCIGTDNKYYENTLWKFDENTEEKIYDLPFVVHNAAVIENSIYLGTSEGVYKYDVISKELKHMSGDTNTGVFANNKNLFTFQHDSYLKEQTGFGTTVNIYDLNFSLIKTLHLPENLVDPPKAKVWDV